jgi:hypothetical protein
MHAALSLLAQGVTSLVLPPSPSMRYSGTAADVLNDSLFAAGFLLLGGFLLLSSTSGKRLVAAGLGSAGVGAVLLSAAILATVLAGEERWDAAYVAGFALSALGYLIAMVGRRSWTFGALLLGTVLALAFYANAGALALGGAVLLVLWDEISSAEESGPTRGDQNNDSPSGLTRPGL